MFITVHGDYGRENVVNVNNISYFISYDKDNSATLIQFNDINNYIIVSETVEEIKNLIEKSA